MTSITVGTGDLVRLLNALSQTAITDDDTGSNWAGILLHCARDPDAPPGEREVLCGTAGNGWVLGHTSVRCQGEWTRPTLWSIDDVRAVVSIFKPKLKADKLHAVAVELSGDGTVTVAEEADLLSPGLRMQFTERSAALYPRNAWDLLAEPSTRDVVRDTRTGLTVPAEPRTDVAAAVLAAFAAVSKILGAPVELYRYHQRRPVQVQIGYAYRGLFVTSSYDDEAERGRAPSARVRVPELPPAPEPTEPAAGVTVTLVRDGRADMSAGSDVVDEPITDFPAVDPDTSLLRDAVIAVVESQSGSVTQLQKRLNLSHVRAAALLAQLEQRGWVGPHRGSFARKVLVSPADLPVVLAALEAPADTASPEEEGTQE